MRVDDADWRPSSLLDAHREGGAGSVIAGVISVAAVHLILPLTLIFGIAFLREIGVLEAFTQRTAGPEKHIVEARFVKLGKQFDPRKLPNRRVPPKAFDRPHGVAVSKTPVDRVIPDGGPEHPLNHAQIDLLKRLAARADPFAEIAQQQDLEGNPEGIEDGTEDTARAGDIYVGQLYRLFRSGWTVPNNVPDDELEHMVVDVDVRISEDRHIASFGIRGSSGNADFDQSVRARLQALQDANTELPEPPPEVASDFLGQTIGIRFRGKQAGR